MLSQFHFSHKLHSNQYNFTLIWHYFWSWQPRNTFCILSFTQTATVTSVSSQRINTNKNPSSINLIPFKTHVRAHACVHNSQAATSSNLGIHTDVTAILEMRQSIALNQRWSLYHIYGFVITWSIKLNFVIQIKYHLHGVSNKKKH